MPHEFYELASDEYRTAANKYMRAAPNSHNYLRFIVEELKPFIDANYRTRPGRDDTFLMGSSAGGMISLYGLIEYPDVFGGAACVSTHWPSSMMKDNPEANAPILAWLRDATSAPSTTCCARSVTGKARSGRLGSSRTRATTRARGRRAHTYR